MADEQIESHDVQLIRSAKTFFDLAAIAALMWILITFAQCTNAVVTYVKG